MRQIANFTVEDQPIARGGMGQIFKGRDQNGQIIAIKEILPEFANDWTILSRIEKEVEFLLKVDHPSIVKLYSAFRDNATQNYYIVMEMVEGENIEQYVTRNGAMPEEMAVSLMLKILDALQCVHNAHIVHRDIKPSNIMIRPNGNICLLDFGVAKDMDGNGPGTIVGSVIGTSGYMSPEQADGYSINFRSDIYSLGCVFYYMLTGHHAFSTLASDFETRDAILKNEFPRLSKYKKGLSDVLQPILDKATDKNMMQRYQNCYEFMAALRNGTHISTANETSPQVLISVGREMCDIIINDSARKISRHHADIELKEFTGGKYYVFTDRSANGTIINRQVLRKNSVNIPANGKAPEIYLAGVPDGHLDWNMVVAELDKRARAIEIAAIDDNKTEIVKEEGLADPSLKPSVVKDPDPNNEYEPKDATVMLIFAYLFAVGGGFLGIILGISVKCQKVVDDNGDKVYKYKSSHRTLGAIAAVIGAISCIVWKLSVR
ncbi:protein kinase [uncultured Prevotella sp.]|uniref:protein kinase domain-containing protein n=1 Tax=uncultured Prevotella sp. TaxID=159272 RepID=UPI0027E23D25|nr:protein kinase [uncultured Prevotella sp.]